MNGTIWLDLQMKNYRTETMSKVLFPGQTVALGVGTSFNADLKPSIGHLEIPLGTEFGPLSLPATKLFEFAVDENVGGAGDDIVFGGQATPAMPSREILFEGKTFITGQKHFDGAIGVTTR
ncbi:TPA: hypothetical protein SMF60_004486 [Serratia marcescens]|nr:hypothetical protein [Serratia marcescens]